ncbi:hypothetical protein [Cellulomonas sp. P5_C5]
MAQHASDDRTSDQLTGPMLAFVAAAITPDEKARRLYFGVALRHGPDRREIATIASGAWGATLHPGDNAWLTVGIRARGAYPQPVDREIRI